MSTVGPPIAIFIHVFAREPYWRPIFDQVDASLVNSGLSSRASLIALGVVGTSDFVNPADYAIVLFLHPDRRQYEFPTLQRVWMFAHTCPDARVLYLHLKGVSRGQVQSGWRANMLAACVAGHATALAALETHDVAGIKWFTRNNAPHFSGNFWWANARYLRTLQDPLQYRHAEHPLREKEGGRFNAEFWIGSGSPRSFDLG
jgi:hypothetical protein